MHAEHSSAAEGGGRSAVSDVAFWAKTRPEGDCLVWTGYRDRQGYGSVFRKFVSPSPMLAHKDYSLSQLAAMYDVSRRTIHMAATGRTWKQLEKAA